MRKIGITTGDPAGIGPEIAAKALRFLALQDNVIFIVYGRFEFFSNGNEVKKIEKAAEAVHPKIIYWIEIDEIEVAVGKPSKLSGDIAYRILECCAADRKKELLDAVVTCPISKEAIRLSHPGFIGHTEFFAESFHIKDFIMSFWGDHFNLALLTTHVATHKVPELLTREIVEHKLRIIFREVTKYLSKPKMAMLAMNPHAGERGAFGSQDDMIAEILKKLKQEGIIIDGPFPADTFFAHHATDYDLIISAFHDQGLIPFKMISTDAGVNVTLGLPFVRTSVDHGTAFDIAGKNIASEKSLLAAIKMAMKMLQINCEPSNSNYSHFANYYDQYMAHVNYENWVEFILNHFFQRYKRHPKKMLELACGTANISSILVKKGLDVDASDISGEMLKIASQKPFRPHLFQHNMLRLLPAAKYDLVLLLFDSINYLLDEQKILTLFNNVFNTLQKKGLFIFDITTIKNCEQNCDGYVNLEDEKDSYLIHQGEYDEEEMMQTTKLTFFNKKGFLYERYDEIHQQRVYRVAEIVELIKQTDFHLASVYSIGFGDDLLKTDLHVLDKNFTRLFFVLEKK